MSEPAAPVPLGARLSKASAAVLGAWLFLREPLAAEVASRAGYDYVCIDLQHGLQSFDTMNAMLAHIAAGPAVPMTRVPALDPAVIGRVIDAGSLGVIVPMVNTPEQARLAVRACRYAPVGDRSVGPMGAGVRFGSRYVANANDVVQVFPMIETPDAIAAVDDIAAVPGVGGLYVGPADLSLGMGFRVGMDQDSADFDAALGRVVAACQRNGIIAGVQASPALVPKRLNQGFTMITVGYDYQPMVAALHNDLSVSRGQQASA
jgi:4-hydroxy-2-oxoheptanedioate aldolase